MRGIPVEIGKALKELERLNGVARARRGEWEVAEHRCRTQAASIAIMWKEHYDALNARIKNRKAKAAK